MKLSKLSVGILIATVAIGVVNANPVAKDLNLMKISDAIQSPNNNWDVTLKYTDNGSVSASKTKINYFSYHDKKFSLHGVNHQNNEYYSDRIIVDTQQLPPYAPGDYFYIVNGDHTSQKIPAWKLYQPLFDKIGLKPLQVHNKLDEFSVNQTVLVDAVDCFSDRGQTTLSFTIYPSGATVTKTIQNEPIIVMSINTPVTEGSSAMVSADHQEYNNNWTAHSQRIPLTNKGLAIELQSHSVSDTKCEFGDFSHIDSSNLVLHVASSTNKPEDSTDTYNIYANGKAEIGINVGLDMLYSRVGEQLKKESPTEFNNIINSFSAVSDIKDHVHFYVFPRDISVTTQYAVHFFDQYDGYQNYYYGSTSMEKANEMWNKYQSQSINYAARTSPPYMVRVNFLKYLTVDSGLNELNQKVFHICAKTDWGTNTCTLDNSTGSIQVRSIIPDYSVKLDGTALFYNGPDTVFDGGAGVYLLKLKRVGTSLDNITAASGFHSIDVGGDNYYDSHYDLSGNTSLMPKYVGAYTNANLAGVGRSLRGAVFTAKGLDMMTAQTITTSNEVTINKNGAIDFNVYNNLASNDHFNANISPYLIDRSNPNSVANKNNLFLAMTDGSGCANPFGFGCWGGTAARYTFSLTDIWGTPHTVSYTTRGF